MKAVKKPKEPVRLREKPIANGNISLYLDIYVDGRRSYEFLKLYLVPEVGKADKEANERTLRLANAIKAQRIVELQNGRFGFEQDKPKVLFFDYVEELVNEREEKSTMWNSLRQVLNTAMKYDGNRKLTLSQIDQEWIKGYIAFLGKMKRNNGEYLRQNTQVLYYNLLKSVLIRAYNDHLIAELPTRGIKGARKEEVRRNYLTIEEIGRLANTPYRNENLKRAFLFSCLTGLRRSDVGLLRWEDISKQGKYHRIMFRQKKTKGQEYLDVSEQAMRLLGEIKESGPVFKKLPGQINMSRWMKDAGINRHISFHCARHTFAVMMLDLGTDLYTVSKLLGHREIGTTQIYAKVLDKNKQAAIDRIPSILS